MDKLLRAACSTETAHRARRPFRMRFQRGDALLEGLIAMVLFAVIALGIAYALVKSVASHRLSNAQNLLIGQIRSTVQSRGIAADCPATTTAAATSTPVTLALTDATSETVTKTCKIAAVTLTPNGGTAKSVNLPVVSFTSSSGGSSNFDSALTMGN